MDIFVVGLYKKGKNIAGFRLLATNPDGTTEVRDEEYNKVKAVASKGLIKNLKVENGELKGVGGSLDRYAERGKSQAVVILKEINDDKGNCIGYFCSDTDGKTRNLTPEQVIQFGDKFSIANGKIVNDNSGKRFISAIEGKYESIKQPTKSVTPVQQVKNTNEVKKQQIEHQQQPQQKQVETPQDNKSKLSQDVQDLIKRLKQSPKFKGDYVEKIVETVEKTDRCSYNQLNVMKKAEEKFNGNNKKIGLTDEVKQLIENCKKCKGYKGSFAEKLAISINKQKNCSEKQLEALKKQYEELSKNNTPEPPKAEPPKAEPPKAEPPKAEQETQENDKVTEKDINNTKSKISNINKKYDKENKDLNSKIAHELVELQKKQMTAKEKRAVNQTIISDDIFDYSLRKNGTAYIEGFKAGIEVPKNVIIPDTTTINNKTYKITGITNDAFASEKIETFISSKNIEDIGQNLFRNCSYLREVDLSLSKHTLIPAGFCLSCRKLEKVDIGKNVQKIHEYAFCATAITEITLSDYTTDIAAHAFDFCDKLQKVIGKPKRIDSYAFSNCVRLTEFDFSEINRIAVQGFRRTNFSELILPGNIKVIGSKAFADCLFLSKVTIEDGVEELGEYCFAKPEMAADLDTGECSIHDIITPKSLKIIEYGAFRHVNQVTGYTGSFAESYCISNDIPFNALDRVNSTNSTTTRIKSKLIGNNPMEALKSSINTEVENASNPEYELNTSKLLNVELNENTINILGIGVANSEVEPHIKFKAAVNYLQDVADIMKLPLMGNVLRLQNTFYVNNEAIYDDGCNKIYKIDYEMVDTLEKGEFILVTMNNKLVYITDCNLYTNIKMTEDIAINDNLPIKEYLHTGDLIGTESTISGYSGIIQSEGATLLSRLRNNDNNVGLQFYSKILRNSIIIKLTNKDRYLYIPCKDIALGLHDRSKDEEKKIEGSCEAITKMQNYQEFLKSIKSINKNIGGSKKFFDNLSMMGSSAVQRYINSVSIINEEREAQLFKVSKAFVNTVHKSGKIPNPNLLDRATFEELSNSYWMIHKDEDWLRATGKKSLNQTAEYNISGCRLVEYKSNQIVKFSNPYMNGKKGAYIFVLTKGNTCLGVYASRYTMAYICEKLYELTNIHDIDKSDIPNSIMTKPDVFDKVSPKLFYHFYDILQTSKGWSFKSYNIYSRYNAEFNISMYKPTGIFYITTTRISTTDKKAQYATIPILPIGDMNKALIVATTTNSNTKNNKRVKSLLDELMDLSIQLSVADRMAKVYKEEDLHRVQNVLNNYITARSLAMSGVKDASKYRGLVDDRILYMMGTVHKGNLLRESAATNLDEIDDLDINVDTVEDIDLDIEDEEIEIDIDEEQEDIIEDDNLDTDEDFDIDLEDEAENEEMSFEDFFNMAKGMGVTDEQQARVMYINFMDSL